MGLVVDVDSADVTFTPVSVKPTSCVQKIQWKDTLHIFSSFAKESRLLRLLPSS